MLAEVLVEPKLSSSGFTVRGWSMFINRGGNLLGEDCGKEQMFQAVARETGYWIGTQK